MCPFERLASDQPIRADPGACGKQDKRQRHAWTYKTASRHLMPVIRRVELRRPRHSNQTDRAATMREFSRSNGVEQGE